jgi:hypothetical protein
MKSLSSTCIHKANLLKKLILKLIRFQGYAQTFLGSLAVYLTFIRINLSTIRREETIKPELKIDLMFNVN